MNQDYFIRLLKKTYHTNKVGQLAELVANSLDISYSGAYKKVSGLTNLTLNETDKICRQLGLVMDVSATQHQPHIPYTFYCDDLIVPPGSYEQWAANILNHSLQLDQYKSDYQVWSYQSDISYFHLMPFRSLLYFKLFAWNRTTWKVSPTDIFRLSDFEQNHALNSLLDPIYQHYTSYHSTEIWHIDFIDGLINQIKYYYHLRILESSDTLITIIKDLKKMILHLEKISQSGHKIQFGKKGRCAPTDVYLNHTHTSPSVLLIQAPEFRIVYHMFLHPNYIRTQDNGICDFSETWIKNVITQSDPISVSGEMARSNFFAQLNNKVEILEQEINEY